MTAEEVTFWFVASAVVGGGSVPVGFGLVLIVEYVQKKWCRPANGTNPIYIQRANAPTDLVPLINGLAKCGIPFDGSELWVFGNDSRYIVNNADGPWRRAFDDWARRGLKIRFILLEADDDVRRVLHELKLVLKDSFDATVLNGGAVPAVARELDTYHPTLFLATGHNAAWIEGLHHRNSLCAYDVEYISPKAMRNWPEKDELFRSCKDRLDLVLENSTSLVGEVA